MFTVSRCGSISSSGSFTHVTCFSNDCLQMLTNQVSRVTASCGIYGAVGLVTHKAALDTGGGVLAVYQV